MASLASAATVIPQFSGLRASPVRSTLVPTTVTAPAPSRGLSVRASLRDVAAVTVATGASLMLASSALSLEILLGGSDGSLAFVPSEFSVSSGEKIVFKNNAGFPHNVVFEEAPPGVDPDSLGMPYDDLLNAPGETFSVTLTEKGAYEFYCAPHQGAGMVGKVTVN